MFLVLTEDLLGLCQWYANDDFPYKKSNVLWFSRGSVCNRLVSVWMDFVCFWRMTLYLSCQELWKVWVCRPGFVFYSCSLNLYGLITTWQGFNKRSEVIFGKFRMQIKNCCTWCNNDIFKYIRNQKISLIMQFMRTQMFRDLKHRFWASLITVRTILQALLWSKHLKNLHCNITDIEFGNVGLSNSEMCLIYRLAEFRVKICRFEVWTRKCRKKFVRWVNN